jgi:hypothetical protein
MTMLWRNRRNVIEKADHQLSSHLLPIQREQILNAERQLSQSKMDSGDGKNWAYFEPRTIGPLPEWQLRSLPVIGRYLERQALRVASAPE